MPSPPDDRALLLRLLSLERDDIDRHELADLVRAWAEDPSRSLGELIRGRLEGLVGQDVLDHNGEAESSAEALSSHSATTGGEASVESDRRPDDATEAVESVQTGVRDQGWGGGGGRGLRYRRLWPHARGGLGEISVAEDLELHRRVALKEIQPGRAGDSGCRERFVVEAEITGNLEHPGIVPVYGLGWQPDGRPYYAMRFIHGEDLGKAIRRFHSGTSPDFAGLEFRWLLRRFIDVCNTIAYAHSRGVLHRDIKPSNIMLGPFGETLVMDWGVAKLVGRPERVERAGPRPCPGEESAIRPRWVNVAVTATGQAVGTPAYMSPEQAAGEMEALGPASDIYSLGATLSVLLTDRVPFRGEATDLLKDVREGRFPVPRAIQPRVPRGLDAICRRATAVEPSRRYASAMELAEDLDRWLADEPVTVWLEPWLVRARRWVRRHQPIVAGAGAAVVMALAALAVAVPVLSIAWRNEALARRAERRERVRALQQAAAAEEQRARAVGNLEEADRQRTLAQTHESKADEQRRLAEQALKFLVEAFRKPDPEVDGRSLKVVDLLDRAVVDLDQSLVDQPLMQATLFNAIGKTFAGLGMPVESCRVHDRALAIRRRQRGEDHPETLESCHNLAMSYQDAGRFDQAIPILRATLEKRRRALGEDHSDTIESMNDLALVYWESGRPEQAIPLYQETLERVRARSGDDHLDTLTVMDNLAVAYSAAGQPGSAIPLHEAVLARLRTKLGDDHLMTLVTMNNLARAYQADGRLDEAIDLRETTSTRLQSRLGADHPTTLTVLNGLAEAYRKVGRTDQALSLARSVLSRRRAKLGPDHPDTLQTTLALAELAFSRQRPAEAVPLAREFLERAVKIEGRLPRKIRESIPRAAGWLVESYRLAGQPELAEEFRRVQERYLPPGADRSPPPARGPAGAGARP